MKVLLIIALTLPIYSKGQETINIDSVVIKFLRTQPNISKPFLTITRNGKKGTVSRNYFYHPNEAVTKDSVKIITYLFGSADSHAPVYLLITVLQPDKEEYKIVESKTIEQGISELFKFIQPLKLSESQKAVLINQLSYTYY